MRPSMTYDEPERRRQFERGRHLHLRFNPSVGVKDYDGFRMAVVNQIRRKEIHLSIMTSVDLMMVRTVSPALSPSCSAEVRLMSDTISMSPTDTMTSAITLPSLTFLTVPLN